MQELLPIIRRQRRPLIAADAPPVAVGNVEPVKVEAVRAKTTKEAKWSSQYACLSSPM